MEAREAQLAEGYRVLYRRARAQGMSEEAAFQFAVGRDRPADYMASSFDATVESFKNLGLSESSAQEAVMGRGGFGTVAEAREAFDAARASGPGLRSVGGRAGSGRAWSADALAASAGRLMRHGLDRLEAVESAIAVEHLDAGFSDEEASRRAAEEMTARTPRVREALKAVARAEVRG